MQKVALIVAGGSGRRMGGDIPKQFLLLKDKPILLHTLIKFSDFQKIILVLPKTQFNYWDSLCKKYNCLLKHTLVAGGKNRFESVKNGLKEIKHNSIVAIHDGVRPLISKKLIEKLISKTKEGTAIVPVIPINDSIRKIDGYSSTIIQREKLYKVQTPQCFYSNNIKEAYTQKISEYFTDDASIFEANGGSIKTVVGENRNIKITTQDDLQFAEALK